MRERERVRESESQRVRESESQRVRESESQRVRESESQRVRESETSSFTPSLEGRGAFPRAFLSKRRKKPDCWTHAQPWQSSRTFERQGGHHVGRRQATAGSLLALLSSLAERCTWYSTSSSSSSPSSPSSFIITESSFIITESSFIPALRRQKSRAQELPVHPSCAYTKSERLLAQYSSALARRQLAGVRIIVAGP